MTNGCRFVHFDSLHAPDLHGCSSYYHVLGKIWAIKLGVGQDDNRFLRAIDKRSLKVSRVPQ